MQVALGMLASGGYKKIPFLFEPRCFKVFIWDKIKVNKRPLIKFDDFSLGMRISNHRLKLFQAHYVLEHVTSGVHWKVEG